MARTTLVALFWPDTDEKTGRANLRRELHVLNRILPLAWDFGSSAVRYAGSEDVRLDLHEVRRLEAEGKWVEAARWLRGSFLEGLSLDENLEFETWLSGERERWRQCAERILLRAAEAAWQQNDPDEAQEYLTRLLQMAPWNEQAYRQLMRLLARQGQHSAALKQFSICRDALARELGVTPSAVTEALARRIRAAANAQPPRLPPKPNAFEGREEEMAAFTHRLLDPHCRLLCVMGLSGMGKSRLALQLAHVHGAGGGRRFLHGAAFVSLADVDETQIVAAVTRGLQLHTYDRVPDERQLLDYLRDREMLLVLDDCEPTAAVCDLLQAILAQAPDVTLLVTARSRLALQQAWTVELGGLETRPVGRSADEARPSPAARLFARAARRTLSTFSLLGQLDDVEALCRDVDGMPLALLLASQWVDVMPPAVIRREIRQSLEILSTESGDLPARQRSIRAVLDLTWQQLVPEARAAAAGLSVFDGPFTSQSALAVLNVSPQGLKQLIACSFIQPVGYGLLAVHGLVKQFLAEKAACADERPPGHWLDRHMTSYLACLAEETRTLRLTLSAVTLQRLQAEWAQFEAAWWHAVSTCRTDLLDDCMDVVMVFEATGSWREGLQFFEQTQQRLPDDLEMIHARLDEVRSLLLFRLFDMREAKRLADRALALLGREVNGTPSQGVYARLSLATYTYLTHGARGYPAFAAAMRELTANYFGLFGTVVTLMLDGARDCRSGNYQRATNRFREMIRRLGPDSYALPSIRCMLGLSYLGLGEDAAAAKQFQLALARGSELGVLPAQVSATIELQQLNGVHEPHDASAALADLAMQTGATEAIGRTAIHVGVQYLNFGYNEGARTLFQIGLRMLWPRVDKAEFAWASYTVGKFLLLARVGHALRHDG